MHPVRLTTRAQWRAWLHENHSTKPAACLLHIEGRELSFQDAVEEALCFGWTDEDLDVTDRSQLFTPRKSGSYWSPYHRSRFTELVKAGLVTDAGMAVGPHTEAPPADPVVPQAGM